jgi:putative two-component system response regulator
MTRQNGAPVQALTGGGVLIIARDDRTVDPLEAALHAEGCRNVQSVTDSRRAYPAFQQSRPDVVVLEAAVEPMDALSVMKQLGSRIRPDELLPFVVIGSAADTTLRRDALDVGIPVVFAADTSPAAVALQVCEAAALRAHHARLADDAAARVNSVRRLEREVAHHLARFAEFKDHPGTGHVERVGELSAQIATTLGLPEDEVEIIRLAAPLHDVGKLAIPEAILLKEEPLTLEEMDVVKTHTTLGASIMAGSTSRFFQVAEEIALYHHENWDGTGYTPGLEGEAIPLLGRIVRVTDAFDAITRARPFAGQWRLDSAVEFIRSQSGQSFDPQVVEAFLEIQAEAAEAADEIAQGLI